MNLNFFRLQRYRYADAFKVNLKLQSIEEHFLSSKSISEEVLSKMQSQIHWRNKFVVSGFISLGP